MVLGAGRAWEDSPGSRVARWTTVALAGLLNRRYREAFGSGKTASKPAEFSGHRTLKLAFNCKLACINLGRALTKEIG